MPYGTKLYRFAKEMVQSPQYKTSIIYSQEMNKCKSSEVKIYPIPSYTWRLKPLGWRTGQGRSVNISLFMGNILPTNFAKTNLTRTDIKYVSAASIYPIGILNIGHICLTCALCHRSEYRLVDFNIYCDCHIYIFRSG